MRGWNQPGVLDKEVSLGLGSDIYKPDPGCVEIV